MKRLMATLICLFFLSSASFAWNEKGHMVLAKMAWKELTAEERAKILKMLESHPHYQEYLKANRPDNIPEDEWIFMRAATWSDWVRGGPPERKAYNKPEWHYINIPFTPPGDDTKADGPGEVNVVKQVSLSKKIAMSGGDRVERAVHLTWIFHLITDMHQPLHCSSQWSKEYPTGDLGGNKVRVKLQEGGIIQLHSFWDGLLGKEVSLSSIGSSELELEKMFKDKQMEIQEELDKHKTPEEWGQESHDQAVKHAYMDGEMKGANADRKLADADIPLAPKGYAQQAGETARYQGVKAAKRLAVVLKEVAAAN